MNCERRGFKMRQKKLGPRVPGGLNTQIDQLIKGSESLTLNVGRSGSEPGIHEGPIRGDSCKAHAG